MFKLATANNIVAYPGYDFAGRSDAGKVHLKMDLLFDSVEDAKTFLVENHLPTVALTGKP